MEVLGVMVGLEGSGVLRPFQLATDTKGKLYCSPDCQPRSNWLRPVAPLRAAELPGDATSKPVWNVFIPASSAITIYSIRDRDIIVDDEGYRYEVGANFWTGLGYQVSTIREEA
jgi:hypothetical protein